MKPTVTTADSDIYDRRESEARSYCRSFPNSFVAARGATLTDSEGRDYIDFLAGCSSLNYGHNDPRMKAALIEHISRDGIAHGLDMHTDAKARFLEPSSASSWPRATWTTGSCSPARPAPTPSRRR
jgi:diaminobutyrate-2-oxoglutarate transaminase